MDQLVTLNPFIAAIRAQRRARRRFANAREDFGVRELFEREEGEEEEELLGAVGGAPEVEEEGEEEEGWIRELRRVSEMGGGTREVRWVRSYDERDDMTVEQLAARRVEAEERDRRYELENRVRRSETIRSLNMTVMANWHSHMVGQAGLERTRTAWAQVRAKADRILANLSDDWES